MRIHITIAEYENGADATAVVVNTTIPDGSDHDQATTVWYRALSAMYGYNIGGKFFDGDEE